MVIHATFIIISAGILLILKSLCSSISKWNTHRYTTHELDIMFSWFWNGTPEEELYAWYKVRTVLKQRDGGVPQEKIAHVDRKICDIKKDSMRGDYTVNKYGQIILSSSDTKVADL